MATVIDSDYVLRSSSPAFNTTPNYLSNSQKTRSTKGLSLTRSRSPDRFRTAITGVRSRTPSPDRLIRLSMSPREIERSLKNQYGTVRVARSSSPHRFTIENNRLRRSVNGVVSPRSESGRARSVTYSPRSAHEREVSEASFKEHAYRPANQLATWSTHPVHLRRERSRTPSPRRVRSRSPSPASRRLQSRSPSPINRSLSTARSRSSSPVRTRLYEKSGLSDDVAAEVYFPTTMKARKINHIEPPLSRSMMTSPPPKHMRTLPPNKWKVDGKVSQFDDERELQLLKIEDREREISKMYNMIEVAPTIAEGSTVHMVSPFAQELASLRLDRLKIEEDHLLEMKRVAEVERLRAPKPYWYELKTPDFHYEAHKNKEMIENETTWNNLINPKLGKKTRKNSFNSYNATEYI